MKKIALTLLIPFVTSWAYGQGMAVNSSGATADASSILDVNSANKGMLIPRMDSAARAGISAPATGLLVYQTNGLKPGFYYYTGSAWMPLISGAPVYDNGTNVGIGVSAPAHKLDVAGNIAIPAANSYKYKTPRTGYVTVSAAAFTPMPDLTYSGNATGNARWITGGTPGVTAQLFAPVSLPDGAVITGMDVYTLDNDATYNANAELVSFNMSVNFLNSIFTTSSTSGAVSAPAVISATGGTTVDNAVYSYYIQFNTYQNNANLWIRGARITYTTDHTD